MTHRSAVRHARRAVAVLGLVVAVVVATGPGPATAPEARPAQAPATATRVAFEPSTSWAPMPPGATARSFVLVDAVTGQELAARDADERVPVASTVKLLTVLTALDVVSLDEVVTVGEEVTIGGAGVGLTPGDTWTVRELVEAVIVRSGNDAAYALAAHAGGDVDSFVTAMQERAAALGLDGAVVEDPTGLDDTNRLSARDLAVIGRAALANPVVREVADLEQVTLPGLGTVTTRNVLLLDRPEATGLKTGQTDAAGWCLVASLDTDDGRELVSVVLGAREDAARFDEAAALLDLGDDDTVPLPAGAARLRVPGGWFDVGDAVTVGVPTTGTTTVLAELGAEALTSQVVHDGAVVATMTTSLAEPPEGDGVGEQLAGQLYAVLRDVHAADGWAPLDR